jgi:hypothetical protein
MFYEYGPKEKVIEVNINEYRAPTDDSIAICNEIREKTIQSIIDNGADQFDVNEIYWVVFDSPETRGMRLSLSFMWMVVKYKKFLIFRILNYGLVILKNL